jgi:hypothetical protein
MVRTQKIIADHHGIFLFSKRLPTYNYRQLQIITIIYRHVSMNTQ